MACAEGGGDWEGVTGVIFDVKRFATDDGPGIRTTVFVKGCPLDCLWCHSPESIRPAPELVFFASKCLRCGSCVAVCPRGAQRLALAGSERVVDHAACDNCGECALVCPSGALEMRGRMGAAGAVVADLAADVAFYRHSDGGVTISGGEPTTQPCFVRAVLQGCRARGIPTALDTNGYANWAVYESLLPLVDLFLFDLKHMDPAEHKRLTGVPNAPILRNLERLVAAGARVQVRLPLIPGFNDSVENVAATAGFARQAGVGSIALLPYNQAAGAKYAWLGHPYPLEHLVTQSEACLAALVATARARGLEAQLGG
ncbi:MAG: glycyl-radical enzyme activating protein [Chloroflexota bacterium]